MHHSIKVKFMKVDLAASEGICDW